MNSDNFKKLAYIVQPDEKIAFSGKRIAVNFVPYGRCTNQCVFCSPNIKAIEKIAGHEVLLKRDYELDELIEEVVKSYDLNSDCSEIIITGTIGEPLLYFDRLLKFIKKIKKRISLPVRLNTNGQANIILTQYSSLQACRMLEEAGLDSAVISLNAIYKKDYEILCKPKQSGAFESVLDFIKYLSQTRIEAYVSFVDYTKTFPNLPFLDKNKINNFCSKLGINEGHVIYRPIID
jgi:TatD family-associated radical SAM protein